jgi:hypothetical protein
MAMKRAPWLGLVIGAIFLSGCISIGEYKYAYKWDTAPSNGRIDAKVRVEVNANMAPEWKRRFFQAMTEENYANWQQAITELIFEDMQKSHIFSKVAQEGSMDYEALIKIVYTEGQTDQRMELSIIDPKNKEAQATYTAESKANFSHTREKGKIIYQMAADLRVQMLNQYQAGGGLKGLLTARSKIQPSPGARPQAPKGKSDVDAVPAFREEEKVIGDNDVAVVIGIEKYLQVPAAEYAGNDAQSVFESSRPVSPDITG